MPDLVITVKLVYSVEKMDQDLLENLVLENIEGILVLEKGESLASCESIEILPSPQNGKPHT